MKTQLKAGVSIIDISPGKGLQLAGYPHYNRANTGIHDPLFAVCIYLDNGKNKIAVVSLDLLKYPKKYVSTVRKRIEQQSTIPGGNIMICCTHTHSGPLVSTRIDLEGIKNEIKPDFDYIKEVEDKIVSVIMDAYNNTFPAQIGVDKGYCGKEQGIGGNRRDPDGPSDPEVWAIGIKDMEDRWRGGMVKYTLHPTVIHGESTAVSADYPCYIRRYLDGIKPGIISMFLQGTAGNQSSRYFREGQTFCEAKRIGETIAKETDRLLNNMVFASDVEVIAKSIETDIDIRKLPTMDNAMKDIKKAQKKLQELKEANAPYVDIRTAEVNLLGSENIYGYALAKSKGFTLELLVDELPVEVQVMGIGDTRFVGIQGELFVEYGLLIKARSPFEKTIVLELANGCLPGYVCTKEAYEEGGYEAGTSLLTSKSGDTLVETVTRLLKKT